VLVAVMLLMAPLAGGPMNRVRRALGLRSERWLMEAKPF